MKKYFNLLAVFFLITFLIAGCSGSGSSTTTTVVQGSSPVIRSLSVQGLPAAPGSLITTTVIAQSAQNLALTYTWTAYNGWSVTNGSNATTATFKVPDTYGTSGTVTVQVTDSYNRYTVNVIPVSTVGNRAPVINTISASPNPVTPGGLMAIAVTASDPDGDMLSYTWQASNGWLIATGQGTSAVTVTAPTQYGVSGTVTVIVDDGHGDAVNWALPVSTYLEFLPSITVSPQPVITSTTLTCNGYYPLDNDLTFNWTVGGLPLTTGNPAVWYSPGLPGYYIVGVTVENGKDGIAISTTTPIQVSSLSPWPMFHGNIQSTGQSPIDTSSITNTTTWTTSTITTGTVMDKVSSPVIGADGTIYVGNDEQFGTMDFTDTGFLYALRPTNGTVKWVYPTGPVDSPPVVGADGTIYVGSLVQPTFGGTWTTYTYALYPTGGLKWSITSTMGTLTNSPAIGADGTVYMGINGSLYALNPTDGSVKWSQSINSSGSNYPPAIGADGTIYVNGGAGANARLDALNPTDGSVKWYCPIASPVLGTPAIGADGTIYVVDSANNVYAINPTDGSLKWGKYNLQYASTSPAIGSNGLIYVGGLNYMNALSITDGSVQWQFNLGAGAGCSADDSPAIGADGTIYFGTNGNYGIPNIFALTSTGGLKWSYTTGNIVRSDPAIGADGTVYIGSFDGYLYAFH